MQYRLHIIVAGIVVLGILTLAYTTRPQPVQGIGTFTQCLTDRGAVMYGTSWCPHCQNQKALFGDAIKNIRYIECASTENLKNKTCERAGIHGFPTWIFANGTRVEGEMTLGALSKKTTCILPTPEK